MRLLSFLVLLSACSPAKSSPLTGKEWQVAAVNEIVNPVGTGGRPLTLLLDDSTHRAYGYGGCNRFSSEYTLSGDSLSFGAAFSTRMACTDADSVEVVFMQALLRVRHFSLTDSLLILSGEGAAIRLR